MDVDNLFVQLEGNVVQLIYLYRSKIYSAYYYSIPKYAVNKVAYVKSLLRYNATVNLIDDRIIIVISDAAVGRDDAIIILHDAGDATLSINVEEACSPPMLRRGESLRMIEPPKKAKKRHILLYRVGVFSSKYADPRGELLRSIKMKAMMNVGPDEKHEVHEKINKSQNWIEAFNSLYEINLSRHEDVMISILKWMGNNYMLIHPMLSSIDYVTFDGKRILKEFKIIFSFCEERGKMCTDMDEMFRCSGEIVDLENIQGWREKGMYLVYSD